MLARVPANYAVEQHAKDRDRVGDLRHHAQDEADLPPHLKCRASDCASERCAQSIEAGVGGQDGGGEQSGLEERVERVLRERAGRIVEQANSCRQDQHRQRQSEQRLDQAQQRDAGGIDRRPRGCRWRPCPCPHRRWDGRAGGGIGFARVQAAVHGSAVGEDPDRPVADGQCDRAIPAGGDVADRDRFKASVGPHSHRSAA